MEYKSYFKHLTYTSQDEKWGIYCTNTGAVSVNPGDPYPYMAEKHPRHYVINWNSGRTLNEYQIIYITSGRGLFKTNNREYQIKPGTIFIIFPNVKHWYLPDKNTGWIEHWVGFRGAYPDLLLTNNILSVDKPVYYIAYNNDILSNYNQILETARTEVSGVQQLIGSKIIEILAQLIIVSGKTKINDRNEYIVEKAKLFLGENIYSTLDINFIASKLSISYKTLCENFRLSTDMTPYQYFLQLKIDKAKDLLAEGDLSVKEISYKLEFQNPFYFSRLFKKKTGIPPSQWFSISKQGEDEDYLI